MKQRIVSVLAIVFLFCSQLFAGQETYSTRVEGSEISVGATHEVYDVQYFDMLSDPLWGSNYTNHHVYNKVQLGVNPEVVQSGVYSAEVKVRVTYQEWTVSGFSTVVKDRILTVTYDGTDEYALIEDLSTFSFEGGHYVQVEILTISSGIDVDAIFIESSIEVERYYRFDGDQVEGSNYYFIGVSGDYIEFNWDVKQGAEYYELEWVHINDYTIDNGIYVPLGDLEYDFYLNSTRIMTHDNWYKIPAIFDHGYVIFRVRPIGAQGFDFSKRYDGEWDGFEKGVLANFPDGNLASFPNARIIVIGSEYDTKMNWAHQVGYTEEGKRFEGLSFMDGLGRGRQSVSHNTVTEQAVVSNVYYDELGRPAISDLPTPVNGEQLMHYPDFNRPESNPGVGYQPVYYDDLSVNNDPECSQTSAGFSLYHGAGEYYSENNPDVDGQNAHIPNAEGFPFSRVTYLEDFTNRPRRIGAFGDDLRMGSGHETEMIYVSPNQAELNKLFGSEVGYYEHYQKMITIDANGQAYAQYTDMAGRVVASFMIGPAPSNLDALSNNISNPQTVDLLMDGDSQTTSNLPPSTMLTHYEYFPEDDVYTFNYGFTPSEYQATCLPQNICLDCVYDLTINITDECGAEAFNKTIQVNGTTFDAICNNEPAPPIEDVIPLNVPVTLIAGRYAITKSLSVNQDAINEYWCTYIDNSTCLTPLSDHFNGFYLEEPFDNCTDELLEEDVVGCDIYKEIMLEDVSPGGQYALYDETVSGHVINDPASQDIFGSNWQNGTYYDDQGVLIDLSDPIWTLTYFIDNFRDEWAEQLLPYHPEICYLDFCELSASSDTYAEGMLDTDDYSVALNAGYFNPLISPQAQSGIPMGVLNGGANNYDPFFAVNGQGLGFVAQIGSSMTDIDIPLTNGTFEQVDIWEYAILQAFDCGPFASLTEINDCVFDFRDDICNLDLVWINFREAYLELRASVYYEAQQAYVADPSNNCTSNECIGSIASGCSDYSNKVSRFGNANAQIGTTGNSLANLTIGSNGITFLNQQVAAGCQQYATQAASEWMNLLSGCDFVNTIGETATTNLEADMITLISSGCDLDNPQGASTSLTGIVEQNTGTTVYSLSELLAAYGLTESNLCSDLLISTPGVYQTAQEALSELEKPLDICACDQVFEAEVLAGQLGITEEEALAQLTGIDLADVDYIICACESAATKAWYPGFDWAAENANANSDLAMTEITIPAQLSCEECTVNCSDVAADISALDTRFGITDFSSAQNYETILTNYLNQQYNYSLAYEDYETFIAQCGASPSDPYCEINPLLTEWAEVMTLVAFRGQLLNDQASQVDLLTENIVYEHSGLNGYFSGNNHWSTQSGTTLSIHLGTTSNNCTIDLTTDIDFENIVGFGVAIPLTNSCSGNSTFQIEVSYIDCGEIQTKLIDGTSNCFEAVECICYPADLTLCNDIEQIYTGPCYQPRLDELYQNAVEAFEQGVSDQYGEFTREYNEQCVEAFNTENFNYTGNFRQYQYTLFYYDQAGNLIQTVAPEGVNELPASQNTAINAARDGVIDSQNPSNLAAVLPTHEYKTTYEYNSYNQLDLTTNPDQDGDTKFWYDHYGRIVASQNPVQAMESKYSYSFYDPQGRPTQVGQVVQSTVLVESIVKVDDLGTSFEGWVTGGSLSEVTLTQYDRPLGALVEAMFDNGMQENLRLRVASVLYYSIINGGGLGAYESATHYSYDIHGNVKEQIQDFPQLAVVEQNLKSTQYEYELISGNVEKVSYQKDARDQMTHEYCYDELNRLTEVFTSTDDVHKTQESHYYYYDYGPLARTELGQYKVQGQDFAYTINGWLKAMNSSTLDVCHDIGKDAYCGYLTGNGKGHSRVAKDVNAYTIGYFDGDYSAIGSSSMEMSRAANDQFTLQGAELYNGNIRHLVTSIYGMENETMGTVYNYDQLQRLTEMTAFYNSNTDNSWTGVGSTQDYFNSYSYDKNGNIKTLQRNGTISSNTLLMDEFDYRYVGLDDLPNTDPITGAVVSASRSNRLNYVIDNGADDAVSTNGDIKAGMSPDNFQYDKIGELTGDLSEGILSMTWRRGDKKIQSITRTAASGMSDLEFVYNPFGLRVLKIEKTKDNLTNVILPEEEWNRTYYAYDANGQCMGVYDIEISSTNNQARIEEHHIYGASRLGMLKKSELIYDNGTTFPLIKDVLENTLGERRYELTNHLGNVQAVITDRKLPKEGQSVELLTSTAFPNQL
ncbi:MAG: hypothetical protein COA99_19035, partial [Moraxellaceae bacterium]